jgi:glucose-1-phosphate thymidylyltransferase
MKIIIPMAGRGSRLRPHTLTVPKPLIPIAGKPMVQRLVEDLSVSFKGEIEEIAFIIGDFGEAVENQLKQIAENLGAKCSIYYQDQPLGPGHAIYCAKESLSGKAIIAFSDTLFKADFSFDHDNEGMIWVQKVDNPSSFGVVKLDEAGIITDFVEKPTTFVSDLAIVGIYYLNEVERLRDQLGYNIENNITEKGEFQITTALEHLKQNGLKFKTGAIEEWLDCGNKDSVVYTNQRILELKKETEDLICSSVKTENSIIIPPCFIGEGVTIKDSVIGPHVSIGSNSSIENSVIKNSVVQNQTSIKSANLFNSMLGNHVEYQGKMAEISLGDYTQT